jgi:hypothetical protein
MPTVIRETVKPMAAHSSKAMRKLAAPFIAEKRQEQELANSEAYRRRKNVVDAKARDLKIKERAAAKAKKSKAA